MPAEASYDQIPYPSLTYAQTHPDRLATMGTLLGLQTAPVERCRYLDIGCAVGGNIIPMAGGLPESEFVGIDNSRRQIEIGRGHVAELGLSNVRLELVDIMDLPAGLGQFDYIIAHGIYSWVPAEVKDGLLAAIRRHLAPAGVAYVSYNIYPGWHLLNGIRDIMLYHTRDVEEPGQRVAQARALLDFLTEAIPAENSALGSFLESYGNSLVVKLAQGEDGGDALLLHDELAEINEPVYFYQFAEHVTQHGLQYLAEVELSQVVPSRYAPEIVEKLKGLVRDPLDMEQYLDFLGNRTFRRTLLCHKEAAVNRNLRPAVIGQFQLASQARPLSDEPDVRQVSVEKFSGSDGAIFATDHPLSKAAMLILARQSPMLVPFPDLVREAAGLAGLDPEADMQAEALTFGANVLRAYSYSSSLIELHSYLPPYINFVSQRPQAGRVARWQAGLGVKVTNLRHERIELDEMAALILRHLDGSRTRDELMELLKSYQAEGVLVYDPDEESPGEQAASPDQILAVLDQELDDNLRFFARAGLLVA